MTYISGMDGGTKIKPFKIVFQSTNFFFGRNIQSTNFISLLHEEILLPWLHFLAQYNIRIFKKNCSGCSKHSILVGIVETFSKLLVLPGS